MLSQRGQGSGKHGTHKSTRSTFLSWEVNSNSLASLVTELPEDQSSDYKADPGQTAEMSGERRNQPLRGRSQAEGCPLAAVSDPALVGFASTRHHRPPATGWPQPLTELRATLRTAAPAQSHLSMPSQYPPTVRGHTFPIRGTRWLAGYGDHAPSSATSPGRLSAAGSRGLQAGSGAPGVHRAPL